MMCHGPGCNGEREEREISHSVVYRERTIVVHRLPAAVCPECGDARLAEETTIYLELPVGTKVKGEGNRFHLRGRLAIALEVA